MRLLIFLAAFAIPSAQAKVVHFSSDHSKVIRQTHVVEMRGNAHFSRDDEDLRADEIDFNQETQIVNARGRVQYQYGSYFVKADAIDLDLVAKKGVITNGNLTNGSFALRGSKMEQIGENRLLVKDFDYTTCLDCPNAWAMTGKEVDITIDGYAYIKDFTFKIKEAPVAWLPYAVMPVKTRRQTGLIFPRFGSNEVYGLYAVQPAFLAINSWSDLTVGAGYYSARGARFEMEGRYALTDRSFGIANLYFTRDKEVTNLNYRYAGKLSFTQELPFNFEAKFKGEEVSDSGYPITYSEDVTGRYEPVLASDLFISRNDPNVSTIVAFRRFRNLLNFDSNTKFIPDFDPNTVQEFPRIVVNTNNQFLFGSKFAAGVEARVSRFSRGAGPFDVITSTVPTSSSSNIIREANRFTLIPSIYTTLNPLPWLSFVPSVQYRAFAYNFNEAGAYPNLARGYLLTQAELSFQLEKVVPTEDLNVSYKHTIRPSLTWNAIPSIQESRDHPFFEQIQQKARPGQYFDYWDIVPLGTSQNLDSYFTPLGHSVTYGFTSQIFKKEKDKKTGETTVSRRFEAKAQQTIDLLETKKYLSSGQRDNRVILSPLFTSLSYQDEKFSASVEYTYYSFLDRYDSLQILEYNSPHRLNAGFTWNFEKELRQGVLQFDRSLSLNYGFAKLISRVSSLSADFHFSINDYIMPRVVYVFDLMSKPNQVLDMRYELLFQSPSRCWSLNMGYSRSIDRGEGILFSLALNLTGSGLGSLEEQLRKP